MSAQESLTLLETKFSTFCQEEQNEIEATRYMLRNLICRYKSSAELAIIAVSFEIAIKEKQ